MRTFPDTASVHPKSAARHCLGPLLQSRKTPDDVAALALELGTGSGGSGGGAEGSDCCSGGRGGA